MNQCTGVTTAPLPEKCGLDQRGFCFATLPAGAGEERQFGKKKTRLRRGRGIYGIHYTRFRVFVK